MQPESGALESGDRVVVTGVDLAFPGVPLLPAGAGPPGGGPAPQAGAGAAQ